MASTIKLKNGSGAPTSGQLVQGEPALDLTNKRLYTENASGTVIEVGTNPAAEITANAGIALPDNQKATFGASDDLQIYHDGSHSYISDQGTGNIVVKGNNFRVYNAAEDKLMFAGNNGADSYIYYDGSAKLRTTATGIDVTGTVTAGGLDSSDNITITKNSSSAPASLTLDCSDTTIVSDQVFGVINFEHSDADNPGVAAKIQSVADFNTGVARLEFFTGSPSSLTKAMQIKNTGDISFYEDTGTTAKFFWDASAESLGIGTNSPSSELHVAGSGGVYARITENNISGTVKAGLILERASTNTDFLIENSGNLTFSSATDASTWTERMRIDSSGNLLVGKTSITLNTEGHAITPTYARFTRDSANPVQFNRTTTDGDIATFHKDGTTVGSIGTRLNRMYIGTGDTGVLFDSTNNAITPENTSTPTSLDATIDLGRSATRFKDLYLSGGVYLGGTGAANHLDDYEEGTWTGTLVGKTTAGSSPTASGTYVKIGAVVTVSIKFTNVDITGATGRLNITGLPFACSHEATTGGLWNSRLPVGTAYRGFLAAGTTTLESYDGDGVAVDFESSGTGTYCGFTLTYRTNA